MELSAALALVEEVEHLIAEKFEGDIYKQAFANVSGVPVDQVNAEQRQCVKLLSFGTRHGGSMKAALNSWKLKKGR
jgi:DNA polymerase I-like protein with 3'-5' exonuclease and polymerase domains